MKFRVMAKTELISNTKARLPFHTISKPIGALCNLDCEYCFYLDKSKMFPGSNFHMTDEVLETHIKGYIASQPEGCLEVSFAWQGGEPTLLGVGFFKRVVELQKQSAPASMKVSNTFQTNGVRLDREWCEFLKANEFLVGISIDGPQEFHDRYRKTKGGKGSFVQVKRGLDHLLDVGVDFNVLTVLQRHNASHPIEIYEGLKALGAQFMQFIPIVERTGSASVSSRSVQPEQFGQFLIEVFDIWRIEDLGRVFVQGFDTALNAVMGIQWTLCVHAPRCGRSIALEHNGDVFACDHLVFDEYKLGNIMETSYEQLLDGTQQTAFGEDKEKRLPPKCQKCSVRYLCNGGCPVQRFMPVKDSSDPLNYLCAGYLAFFQHIEPYLQGMKAALENRLPASQYSRYLSNTKLKPRRNDPCPCGSGRKFKLCCGP